MRQKEFMHNSKKSYKVEREERGGERKKGKVMNSVAFAVPL
jgi:hypothetical protein